MKLSESPPADVSSFEDFIKEHGFILYTNNGFSMMPLLREKKDIIEIRPLLQRPQKYDVVLYKRRNSYILHRILKVLPDGYIIAGDHNTFLEKDVTDDMILGVMTKVIRNGRTITPDSRRYKLYVHLWCDYYPLRMLILKIKYRIRGYLGAIKRRIVRLAKKESSK